MVRLRRCVEEKAKEQIRCYIVKDEFYILGRCNQGFNMGVKDVT